MKIARIVVIVVAAAAACVDGPGLDQVDQADTGRDPPTGDQDVPPYCDQDGDALLNPECGGCDLDDRDPRVSKRPDCDEIFKCPSYVCVPPGGGDQ